MRLREKATTNCKPHLVSHLVGGKRAGAEQGDHAQPSRWPTDRRWLGGSGGSAKIISLTDPTAELKMGTTLHKAGPVLSVKW
jgi:hypothetical protein